MDSMSYIHTYAQCPVAGPHLWPVTTCWTVRDVYRYICDIGYSKYAKCFKENAITGKDLENINAFDLQRLGVSKMKDAMRLSALISKTTSTMLPNMDNLGTPPNLSYDSGFSSDVKTPMPSLRDLYLPYRDHGDRSYRYDLPVQSYHDHCMVLGRTDAWKLYNSEF